MARHRRRRLGLGAFASLRYLWRHVFNNVVFYLETTNYTYNLSVKQN